MLNWTKFTPKSRLKSFNHAIKGICTVLKSQPNIWIIILATIGAIGAGITLRLSPLEWCVLFITIFIVWIAETFNSALEFLVDLVSPQQHPLAEKTKDAAAGASLTAAILSLIVGMFLFGPRLIERLL